MKLFTCSNPGCLNVGRHWIPYLKTKPSHRQLICHKCYKKTRKPQ